jgi:hypothetical protein
MKESAAMKQSQSRSAMFEPLEPRLLLAGADWLASAVDSDHVMSVAPVDRCTMAGAIAAAGEAQVYRFTSRARGAITIRVTGDGAFNPFLQIYNTAGRLIRQNDNAKWGTTDSAATFSTLADQTYYVRVTGARQSAGRYSVAVISKPVDDYGNTQATARALPQTRWDVTWMATGNVDYPGDVDVRVFVAAKTGTMQIQQGRLLAQQSLCSDLSVYDLRGNLLARAGTAGEATATVNLAVVAGQVYYLHAAGVAGTTGVYLIRAMTLPPPSPAAPQGPAPAGGSTNTGGFAPGVQVTTTTLIQPSGLQLVVLGTDAADVLTLSQTDSGLVLTTSRGAGNVAGVYASVVIYGFGGNDTLKVTNAATVGVTIMGGDGNDTIFDAGCGRDTVYGGAGDDLIVTVGGGSDTIYGQDGFDSVWMDTRDTLADASAAETAAGAVHRIDQFYQPTSNPSQAVPLEIAGQNLVEPTTSFAYQDFSSRPLFAVGPKYSDARQGSLGDCYFIASLASLADKDPRVIQQMIAPMGDGTYAVRFYRGAQAAYVRVDGKLPAYGGRPIYADLGPGGQTWVALAEKAYAQFRYNQNSYDSLAGGWMSDVYRAVTGAAIADLFFNYTTPAIGPALAAHLAAGHAVTAATKAVANVPFVGNHAYMVKSIETSGGQTWVTVYNPWGVDGKTWDSNPADGLIRVTLGQFQSTFVGASVSLV